MFAPDVLEIEVVYRLVAHVGDVGSQVAAPVAILVATQAAALDDKLLAPGDRIGPVSK